MITPERAPEVTLNLVLALVQTALQVMRNKPEMRDAMQHLMTAYLVALAEATSMDEVIKMVGAGLDDEGKQLLDLISNGMTHDQAKKVLEGEEN